MSNNPLTQEQLRRVDAWLSIELFDFQWIALPHDERNLKHLASPEQREGFRRYEFADESHEKYADWDSAVPRFTDPGSPRRLLEEAVAKTVEKVGEAHWVIALYWVVSTPHIMAFETFSKISNPHTKFGLPDVQRMAQADSVTIAKSIVLALGGNWSEVINGN